MKHGHRYLNNFSVKRRWLIALLAGVLLLTGFTGTAQASPQPTQSNLRCAQTHLVQRGENLYRISLRYNVSMGTLQAWNRIRNPNRIYVGQRLCVAVRSHEPERPSVRPTDVEFVTALETVRIRRGPGLSYHIVGHLRAGMTARVTGISHDGLWWQVLCPDDSAGSCWVSAAPSLTQPVKEPQHGPGQSTAIVQSVAVEVRESYPVQVAAVVRGHLPDGCTYIDRWRVTYVGTTVRIQLITGRDGGFCTQALVPFEEVLTLDVGEWLPGLYSVVVDNVRTDFYLP